MEMTVKWRQKNKIAPETLIKKYKEMVVLREDGSFLIENFEYLNILATLYGMIEFPNKAKELNRENIISEAMMNMAKKDALNGDSVIYEINAIVKNQFAVKEQKYHILTTLSVHPDFPIKSTIFEDCKFRLLKNEYPEKYTGRDNLSDHFNTDFTDTTPWNYSKIIITIKAKSTSAAASKALRVIDIKRSIWCLFSNRVIFYFGDRSWQPINNIRLGEFHTIHDKNGKICSEEFWYDPNFVKANLFKPKNHKNFKKIFKWAIGQINQSSYGDNIKQALLRYVRALDEKDHNVALIKLWGAFEELVTPFQADNDKIIKRVSFLFEDRTYHTQILENIREYRNKTVHAGETEKIGRFYCDLLHYYFFILIKFHLNNAQEFTDLDEANRFLDQSSDKRKLERQIFLLEKAKNFIS